jgi:hypothetical protein
MKKTKKFSNGGEALSLLSEIAKNKQANKGPVSNTIGPGFGSYGGSNKGESAEAYAERTKGKSEGQYPTMTKTAVGKDVDEYPAGTPVGMKAPEHTPETPLPGKYRLPESKPIDESYYFRMRNARTPDPIRDTGGAGLGGIGEMYKKGGKVKAYAKGGSVSASRRADGCAQRGKTKGRFV